MNLPKQSPESGLAGADSGSGLMSKDLGHTIRAEPWLFQFLQAVRVLTLDARNHGIPVHDQIPSNVRFRTPSTLEFPACELVETKVDGDAGDSQQRLSLYISFLGLTGPSGVLPTRYTELLIDRKNNFRDSTLHDFLDIFSHRAISLFYNASQKYRFYRQLELNNREGFSRNLLDLVGVGLQGLRDRLHLTREPGEADRFLMYHAGLLAQKPISSKSLETLVRGLIGVDARLELFRGHFFELDPALQSSLNSNNCELGVNTMIGTRQYDCQSKATLAIGPLQSNTFADLLPGGTAARALRELVQFCVGHSVSIEVKLILHHDCIPAPYLSKHDVPPMRLGFNSWILSQCTQKDRTDTRYTLQ